MHQPFHSIQKNGWSQEELAEQLGVSRQAVSKWESAGSIPDLQKVIQLAALFGVSTDYLLRDDIAPEQNTVIPRFEEDKNEPLRRVSMEEANEFLEFRKKGAPTIANATALCILSPVLLVILGALSEEPGFHISEGLAAGLGCTVLFGMISIAVFMFITYGVKASHMEHLEKYAFETEYGVTGIVKEKNRLYEGTFTRRIAVGVVPCNSHLSWMELLDDALGFYMDRMACSRGIICSYFRYCKSNCKSGRAVVCACTRY